MTTKPAVTRNPRTPETAPRKKGGGRTPLPPGQAKISLSFRVSPDLYDWIKSLPHGSAERILQEAHTDSLIV